jgi:hypothetical protein
MNSYDILGGCMILLALVGFVAMARPRRGYRAGVKRVNELHQPPKGPAPGVRKGMRP